MIDHARRLLPAVLPGLLLGGLVVLAFRLQGSADELDRVDLPGPVGLAAVALLALGGQVAFGVGWDRLWPSIQDPVGLAWTFHGAQPAKYLPVGVAQPLGQVALVRRLGVDLAPAVGAWGAQIATIVAAGLFVGAPVGLADGVPPAARLGVLGFAAPLLVARPVLATALHTARRVVRRLPDADRALPGQRALNAGFGAAVFAVLAHGAAFAVVAGGDAGPSPVRLVAAYAFATGVSVATPLPAGLGVREALIVALAGLPAAAALAAAVVVRLVLLGVEALLFVGTGLAARRVSRSRPGPPPGKRPGGSGP